MRKSILILLAKTFETSPLRDQNSESNQTLVPFPPALPHPPYLTFRQYLLLLNHIASSDILFFAQTSP